MLTDDVTAEEEREICFIIIDRCCMIEWQTVFNVFSSLVWESLAVSSFFFFCFSLISISIFNVLVTFQEELAFASPIKIRVSFSHHERGIILLYYICTSEFIRS